MSALGSTWKGMPDQLQAVAIRAWGFVASNQSERARFLSSACLSPADLERQPIRPEHLAALLDFLITNEATLLEFARAVDLPPEAAYEARRLLKRGESEERAFLLDGERRDDRYIGFA